MTRRFRRAMAAALLAALLAAPCLAAPDRPFPYELAKRDRWLLPASAGLLALGGLLYERSAPITLGEIEALDRDDVNAVDRPATYNWSPGWAEAGDLSRAALLGSSVLVAASPGLVGGRWSEALTLAAMAAETFFAVGGVTALAKAAVRRERPYLYNTDLGLEERLAAGVDPRGSFISGHTSAAFAAAAFVSTVATDLYGPSTGTRLVWAASLSLAALTAFARVEAGLHFPTDAVVGAAAGFAIGWLVPALHRKGRSDRLTVAVGPGLVGVGLTF